MLPLALPPLTAHVTAVLLVFVTVAPNCAVCAGQPGWLGNKLDGTPALTVTVIGGPVLLLPATPPQESSAISPSANRTPPPRPGLPHLFPPTAAIPAIKTHASVKKGKMLGPELAKGRPPAGVAAVRGPGATPCRNCAPEFGPKVGIVTVTTVEPAPA